LTFTSALFDLLAGDGGDGEVTFDGRLHALAQWHGRDVNAAANLKTSEVDRDGLRNAVRRASNLDLVADDVEHATTLQARGGTLVDEANRNHDANVVGCANALKINVDGEILDGIKLDFARQNAALLAVDVDVQNRRQKATPLHHLPKLVGVEGDRLGLLLLAVDYGRYLPLTTHCPGGPLTSPGTRRGRDFDNFSHGCSPMKKGPVTARVYPRPPRVPKDRLMSLRCGPYNREDGS